MTNRCPITRNLHIWIQFAQVYFSEPETDPSSSLSLPPSLSHRYCIDHNNVSGDTPFHGHSSETELHKPFTTRSP